MTKGLAVIYDRASTKKQEENYTRQDVARIGTEIAKRYGYDVEPKPRTEIKSGEELRNREVMLGILKDIEVGKTATGQRITAIIVPNFTRLSRDEDIIDGLVIKKTCHDNGVVVIDFSGKVYDFDKDNDQDAAFLELWFGARDKRQMMTNLMRGAMERARNGKYMGGPAPLGYSIRHSGETNRRGKQLYELVIKPDEAELVRRIFRMYTENGAARVAILLNLEGVALPPKNKGRNGRFQPRAFTGADIMRIVTNPHYAGWRRWAINKHKNRPRSKYLKDFEPQTHFDIRLQIISQKEFDRTQRLVAERRIGPARAVNGQYAFSHILKCPYCGGAMIANARYNKKTPEFARHFYGCGIHRENRKACPKGKYITGYPVAFAIIPLVANLLKNTTKLTEALTQAARGYAQTKTINALEAETRAGLAETEQGIKRILDSIADGLISHQEAKAKLDELREKKERLLRELRSLEERDEIRAEILEAISFLESDVEAVLWDLFRTNPRVLGRILRLVFKPRSVVVEAYGEMKVRKGKVVYYELQDEFKDLDVVLTHPEVHSSKGCVARWQPLPSRA